MRTLKHLIANNREWVKRILEDDRDFFDRLSKQQSPEILWIGCSDSRVPANQIVNLLPGELFVHRNVANLVVHTDFNCLSVLQFAVEVLQVKHVIVCGHYGCGGVRAALERQRLGLIDNWLQQIVDIHEKHARVLSETIRPCPKADILCELNVIEQSVNLCNTTIVREAWGGKMARGARELSVHSWIYDVADGLIRDLGMCVTHSSEVESAQVNAVKRIGEARPS